MSAKVEPDRRALEMAHFLLKLTMPLDQALENQTFRRIIRNVARRHMQRAARFDPKRLQANDAEAI